MNLVRLGRSLLGVYIVQNSWFLVGVSGVRTAKTTTHSVQWMPNNRVWVLRFSKVGNSTIGACGPSGGNSTPPPAMFSLIGSRKGRP